MRTPASIVTLAFFGAGVVAQKVPEFAPPVRISAGETILGEGRLFPSPMLHDLDGDGAVDIVVGDLWGKISVAHREPEQGAPTYRAEEWAKSVDGKDLDFGNW